MRWRRGSRGSRNDCKYRRRGSEKRAGGLRTAPRRSSLRLAAHLRVTQRRAVHPLRHVVAADAGIGARTLGHDSRAVVGTAGTEIRDALSNVGRRGGDTLEFFQPPHARGDVVVAMIIQKPLAEADRDLIGIERAFDREQPIAAFILLADANRLVRGAVKLLTDLHFDQRTLFFDHDDQIEAFGKFLQLALAERPNASDLVEADAKLIALELVDAEFVKSLADIEIALASRDNADFWIASAGGDGAIKLVGAHEGEHGITLVIVQPCFLRQDLIV